MKYHPGDIEKKWQDRWAEEKTFRAENTSEKPPFYVLDMFPYPSGAGLHVGHPLGYIASDIYARYKRLKGFNVLHPMGYDSFGLPAEQYAIQTGTHPAKTTRENIDTYRRQMDSIGFSFDWDREVRTSDPSYYKWTQWIFLQLFEAWYCRNADAARPIARLVAEFEQHGNKDVHAHCDETPLFSADEWNSWHEAKQQTILLNYRIAYLSEAYVNWCPQLGTVLANDEVKDGVSERGGYPVERKLMKQWSMRITAYSQRLLDGLDEIDWSESMKEMQRNWIGRSEGTSIKFEIMNSASDFDKGGSPPGKGEYPKGEGVITVFTTRPDTIFGVTFMTLAPEHELVAKITTPDQKEAVEAYITKAKSRSDRERMADVKTISGEFTGAYAVHPFTGDPIPIWIGDYVLAGYGTGAVMAVPSGDQRDWDFARHFNIPIIPVIEGSDIETEANESKDGILMNSDFLNGLKVKDAISLTIKKLEEKGIGEGKINYRQRDAVFGRQRYWGEPIPIYYKDGVPYPVKEEHLPLELPEIDEYLPTETGEPPLARAKNWFYDSSNGVCSTAISAGGEHGPGSFPAKGEYPEGGRGSFPAKGEGALMNLPKLKTFRTELRNNLTPSEAKLWTSLSKKQLGGRKFRRQHSVGDYILDFYCPSENLAIELDGAGNSQVNVQEHDHERTLFLEHFGIKVIRFENKFVFEQHEAVLDEIKRNFNWKKDHPVPSGHPSFAGGEQPSAPTSEQGGYPIELSTMPGWAGSSWYYLRYMDPHNDKEFASKEAIDYWGDVDFYLGGAEHATGHLLYVRFWTKFLKDLGHLPFDEPAKKLINQGMIQGRSSIMYRQLITMDRPLTSRHVKTLDKPNVTWYISKSVYERYYYGEQSETDEKICAQLFSAITQQAKARQPDRVGEVNYGVRIESRVDVSLVTKNDELDIHALRNSRKEYQNAIFTLEDSNGNPVLDHPVRDQRSGHLSLAGGELPTAPTLDQGGSPPAKGEYPKGEGVYKCGWEVEKMSKSKYNVVNPDDIIAKYGADTLRLYEMFLGPLEDAKPWNTNGIEGVYRFLKKFWNLYHDNNGFSVSDEEPTKEELRALHATIKKVQEDIERLSFNTAVSQFMICVNELTELKCNKRAILEPLTVVVSTYAPHICEELWGEERLGHEKSITFTEYPTFNESYLVEDSVNYPISFNGKTRLTLELPASMGKDEVEQFVLANEDVQKRLDGASPKKVIVVPKRIVNIVV